MRGRYEAFYKEARKIKEIRGKKRRRVWATCWIFNIPRAAADIYPFIYNHFTPLHVRVFGGTSKSGFAIRKEVPGCTAN